MTYLETFEEGVLPSTGIEDQEDLGLERLLVQLSSPPLRIVFLWGPLLPVQSAVGPLLPWVVWQFLDVPIVAHSTRSYKTK